MAMQDRIMILTGELGDGHKQAAHALREAAGLHAPHADVQVLDFMALISPRLHAVSKYLYLQGVHKFPSVYGYLYQKTRRPSTMSQLLNKLSIYGISRLHEQIRAYRPTVIVSTFPAAAAAVSALKSSGLIQAAAYTVITDHTDHSYWLHPATDHYCVGSGHVRNALMRHHIPDSQITVTGIPVRASFSQPLNPVSLRETYSLSLMQPTILLMGGGYGMLGRGIVNLLLSEEWDSPMQLLIVCGHNKKLREELEQAALRSKHHVRITGYIHHVHEWMALSDLIITKPGGLTTSEAIASGLPMLLYRPLPGQEQDNAQYLVESGLAVQAYDDKDLGMQLKRLLQHPQLLRFMREQAGRHAAGDASVKVLEAVLSREMDAYHRLHSDQVWYNQPAYFN